MSVNPFFPFSAAKSKMHTVSEKSNTGRFERICCLILSILFTALFALFVYFSIKGTYADQQQSEQLFYASDFIPWHILAFFLFMVFFATVIELTGKIDSRFMLVVFMAGIIWIGCLWVSNIHTMPQVDQLYIKDIASDFNHGDFSALQRGGYVSKCRQQLGIITFLRVFYCFFGDRNTGAFEYANVIFMALIYLAGFGITGCISGNERAGKIYLILNFLAFPILFYTPFVYGELLSTALNMLGIWALYSALKNFSIKKCVIASLLTGLAVQIRENSLIVLIAAVICLLIKLISDKKKSTAVILFSMIIGTILLQGMTAAVYARHIPADSKAMPASLYIAMGMTDNDLGPGWNNGYNWDVFAASDNDPQTADQTAKALIRERLSFFRHNPGAAAQFFYMKLTTQWNDPLYQSLASSNYYWSPPEDMDYEVIYGSERASVYSFLNYYQSFIYFCMLLYSLYTLKIKSRVENNILPLAVLGGAMFSLLWEAKSRYVVPYYILMIPCAAFTIDRLLRRYGNEKNKEEGAETVR